MNDLPISYDAWRTMTPEDDRPSLREPEDSDGNDTDWNRRLDGQLQRKTIMLTQKQLNSIDRIELCRYRFTHEGVSGYAVAVQGFRANGSMATLRHNEPNLEAAREFAALRYPGVPRVVYWKSDAKPYPEHPRPLREVLAARVPVPPTDAETAEWDQVNDGDRFDGLS